MITKLEQKIKDGLRAQDILLMSHVVMGYPSFEQNLETAIDYGRVGVDLIELQFPFSEPIADGPILMVANQTALEKGTRIDKCFEEAARITQAVPSVGFLIMTYYNIIFQIGEREFVRRAAEAGILGIIVPDLPPEESGPLANACDEYGVAPIFLVTPRTPLDRLTYICNQARGMVYCVARTGVTGYKTLFTPEFDQYIDQCKSRTKLPVGVGFGVKTAADVQYLIGKADVAIVCSEAVKIAVDEGSSASAQFLKGLRNSQKVAVAS